MGRPACGARYQALILALAVACATAPIKPPAQFSAPPQALLGEVSLTFRRAWAAGGQLYVEALVTNAARLPMEIDGRQWALRLPDARTVNIGPDGTVITLAPQEGKAVTVAFPLSESMADALPSASLIVGGVRQGNETVPHVAGELPLQAIGSQP